MGYEKAVVKPIQLCALAPKRQCELIPLQRLEGVNCLCFSQLRTSLPSPHVCSRWGYKGTFVHLQTAGSQQSEEKANACNFLETLVFF